MDNNKTVKDYDNYIRAMVTKIMKAKRLHFPYEKEDLVQQIWMEVIKDGAKDENPGDLPDFALIPSICWTTIYDMIRYDTAEKRGGKVQKVSLDPSLDFIKELSDEEASDKLTNRALRPSIDKLWKHLDEKEKIYFKFWLEKVNIEDFGIHPPEPKFNENNPEATSDEYTEDYIAKQLGFPSGSAASYRRFRDNFRKKVKKYVGNWIVSKVK